LIRVARDPLDQSRETWPCSRAPGFGHIRRWIAMVMRGSCCSIGPAIQIRSSIKRAEQKGVNLPRRVGDK
jgi:hypothetical protein